MIGSGELIVILGLSVLLFGSKKVPELARSLGLGIREFKRACQGMDEEVQVHEVQKEKESLEPSSIVSSKPLDREMDDVHTRRDL